MICAAYCRVSTDSEDQANSFENQKAYFEREIEKSGNTLFRIYADQGLTGTKLDNRPEFLQMLHDAGVDCTTVNPYNDRLRLNNALKYDTGVVMQKYSYPHKRDDYTVERSDKIPAIIPVELFEKCQSILHDKVNYKSQNGIYHGHSKYSNMIFCGKCGTVYYSNTVDGYTNYTCKTKKLHGIKACNSPVVAETRIDAFIEKLAVNGIKQQIYRDKQQATNLVFQAIKEELSLFNPDNDEKAKQVQKEIEAKKEEIKNYYQQKARSDAQGDVLQELINDTSVQINALQTKYDELTKDYAHIIISLTKLVRELYHIQEIVINSNYTVKDVYKLIDKIVISDGEIQTHIQFHVLGNVINQYQDKYGNSPQLNEAEVDTICDKLTVILPLFKLQNVAQCPSHRPSRLGQKHACKASPLHPAGYDV